MNKHSPGILAWVLGDRSTQTFNQLWKIVKCWQSFWYATDSYVIYKQFVEEDSHVVSKTCMTRVEGENTRLRHYWARLHRKTLCYSKSQEMLKVSINWNGSAPILHRQANHTILAPKLGRVLNDGNHRHPSISERLLD